MDRTPLSATEQRTIRHQFYQVRSELDQWIQLAGAVLARTAQNASVVTPPRAQQARLKHLELISIHDTTALMVLVLHDGTIRQQTLTLDMALSQEDLSRCASRINERCADAPVERVEEFLKQERTQMPPGGDALACQVLDLVVKAMHQFNEHLNSDIHSDGLIEILNQPEFSQVERVRRMVEILQSRRALGTLIPRVLSSSGVQVVIGGEHSYDEMREYSVVLSRYGGGEIVGVLGVIGPTRMAYPRAISAVRYISAVMSDLLAELYGIEGASRWEAES